MLHKNTKPKCKWDFVPLEVYIAQKKARENAALAPAKNEDLVSEHPKEVRKEEDDGDMNEALTGSSGSSSSKSNILSPGGSPSTNSTTAAVPAAEEEDDEIDDPPSSHYVYSPISPSFISPALITPSPQEHPSLALSPVLSPVAVPDDDDEAMDDDELCARQLGC